MATTTTYDVSGSGTIDGGNLQNNLQQNLQAGLQQGRRLFANPTANVLMATALGAAAVYLLDPTNGRARRDSLLQKSRGLLSLSGNVDSPAVNPGIDMGSDIGLDTIAAQWSPLKRSLGSLAALALIIPGFRRKGWMGYAMALGGSVLLARGLTNKNVNTLVGPGLGNVKNALGGGIGKVKGLLNQGVDGMRSTVGDVKSDITYETNISIDAPVEEVFRFFTNYENFPKFMRNIKEVTEHGDGRSHWTARGPAGAPVSWEARVTNIRENDVLAWESIEGSIIRNSGLIRFMDRGDSTDVRIHFRYNPPLGKIGHAVSAFLGADPRAEMDEDLQRVKTFLETGEFPQDASNSQNMNNQGRPYELSSTDQTMPM